MDFKRAAKLGNYLSKDYAEDFFNLLVNYQDISASEAASRLGSGEGFGVRLEPGDDLRGDGIRHGP